MSSWTKAVPCEDVRKGPVVFKVPPKQVALFYADDAFYAVDNRCPHEGYPLSEGNVDDIGFHKITCKVECDQYG